MHCRKRFRSYLRNIGVNKESKENIMKLMKTEEAVGQVLCHDITQIIPGVTKDAVFRKGHIITKEDIPVLLSVGKEHIYIWEKDEHMLHENEAAQILYEMCQNEHQVWFDSTEREVSCLCLCTRQTVEQCRLTHVWEAYNTTF